MLAVILPVAVGIADGPLGAQSPDISWEARAGGKMAFEVASVKPTNAFRRPNFPLAGDEKTPGGRFSSTLPLLVCITFAYKLEQGDISTQLPKSFPTHTFDIEARAPGNPTKDRMRLMMQSLLADRFKLRVHFETREGPLYALTLVQPGHTGPKLRPHEEGPACPDSFDKSSSGIPAPPRNASDVFPPMCGSAVTRGTREGTWVGGRDVTMERIAIDTVHSFGSLVGEVDRPVVDQTGLKRRYDFRLELPAGILSLALSSAPPATPADSTGTPFLDALRKQLGLKLVSSKGPIRRLVIDHVEPPSANWTAQELDRKLSRLMLYRQVLLCRDEI
jgi:bla regulator protein BlaR1